MIIGISGKKGSGKDTVGKIIQYLTNEAQFPDRFHPDDNFVDMLPVWEDGNEGQGYQWKDSGWKIKKFAGKLKQVCSLLTGIPVEDFEKEEVKNSLLGPQWNQQEKMWTGMAIISEDDLIAKYGYDKAMVALTVPSYKERQKLREKHLDQAKADGYEKVSEIGFYGIPQIQEIPRTVRWLLQTVGTEAMRDRVHTNVWINSLFADYKGRDYIVNPGSSEQHETTTYPNWIITDVRFPNEASAVLNRGGLLIRIERLATDPLAGDHPSETSLDHHEFDHIVHNDGTLEDLISQVKHILKRRRII